MPWVRFAAPFDWHPPEARRHTVLAFQAGDVCLVRRRCFTDALTAGTARPATSEEIADARRRIAA
ncbi:hypothetical protein [Blastochloris tepida]|uniref:Uncharacterized protein n=1 Tax=Blastochloris tepida TaxID=2233851 RepID=A0A348G1E3_9HYPH|nr:hypothetical protein [Blastochloris tepida]BBF93376.1 hypothetical protein BLTE_20610 [Blastochloris tepida]